MAKATRELEVWGGHVVIRHRFATPHHHEARLIVRTRSRAAVTRALTAAGVLGMTDNYIRDYWGATGNKDELAATSGTEGVVFVTTGMLGGVPFEAERLEPKKEL